MSNEGDDTELAQQSWTQDELLDAALDSESEGWIPEVGEKLKGRLLSVGVCACGGFGNHPLLDILTDEGKSVAVHAFHVTLANAVDRLAPQAGQRVGIKYFGEQQPKDPDGQPFHRYRMVVSD